MTTWQQVIGYLVIAALIFAAGWRVCSWKDEAALKARDDQIIALQDNATKVASAYELERQQHSQTIADLQKKVRVAHAKNPNTACVLDGDSVQSISDAIESAR